MVASIYSHGENGEIITRGNGNHHTEETEETGRYLRRTSLCLGNNYVRRDLSADRVRMMTRLRAEKKMSTNPQRCYLLMMRHAVPSKDGRDGLNAVSRRLSETIRELDRLKEHKIMLYGALHGDSELATSTAHFVCTELRQSRLFDGPMLPHPLLNGVHASPYSGPFFESEKSEALNLVATGLETAVARGGNAILVVGHQPLIGIIAGSGIGARPWLPWVSRCVPLAQSEIACLAARGGKDGFGAWRLMWTIAPSDETALTHLREKIVAKMTVASVIGSVVAAALVLVLDGLFGNPPSSVVPLITRYIAALCLFVAAWLYLATVYFCDRLLMPVRFWGESDQPAAFDRRPRWLVWRPPGSATWIVYQNMLHIWRWFFVLGTALAALGTLLLGVALFAPAGTSEMLLLLGSFAAGVAALIGYCVWRRPVLGVED